MKNSLKYRCLQFVQRHGLIVPREKLLAAVSGGLDSMVILHLLQQWQTYFQSDIGVVHINHRLRGRQSDADAEFVREYCRQQNLPVFIRNIDVREFARSQNKSLEEAGHLLRRQIFLKIAGEKNYHKIVTGHHLNDQVETVLMRLLLGSGWEGLAGIRLQAGKIVRPLLFASREEIEHYARMHNIEFREDASNIDTQFLRNRVRRELIPFLENQFDFRHPEQILTNSLIIQDWLNEFQKQFEPAKNRIILSRKGNEIVLDISAFKSYFSGIQIKILNEILQDFAEKKQMLSYHQFQDFLNWLNAGKSGSRFMILPEVQVHKEKQKIIFSRLRGVQPPLRREIFPEQSYDFPEFGFRMHLNRVPKSGLTFSSDPRSEFLDDSRIKFPLILRKWEPGDRFKPLGMNKEKLISDFLTDLKIKMPQKKNIAILESLGNIVCIPGIRISEDYKVTGKTTTVLNIQTETL